MDTLAYLFGEEGGNCFSFPVDHTAGVFKRFLKYSRNECQICVHRHESLLYICYIRRMNGHAKFGVCLCMDRMYTDFKNLFLVFDHAYTRAIAEGKLLKMNEKGEVLWCTTQLATAPVDCRELGREIIRALSISSQNTKELPPTNFGVAKDETIETSLEAPPNQLLGYVRQYSNVYITPTNSEIERVTSYANTIRQYKKTVEDLNAEVAKLKRAKRNTTWVSILGFAILLLGGAFLKLVVFPDQVTNYTTSEFQYYGPIDNGKPHGLGVAFYPADDKDGRKYYIGNFQHGVRSDTAAVLMYNNGDYFYGNIQGPNFVKGMLFIRSDASHYAGTFGANSEPYTGTWFDHYPLYEIKQGKKQ